MTKTALFVFNGDPMCFVHVLLNALDLDARGATARIVVEGAATGLLPELDREGHPLAGLWREVKSRGLVAGVCKACATKLKTVESARSQDLALLDEMQGHPSMGAWRERGYELITF